MKKTEINNLGRKLFDFYSTEDSIKELFRYKNYYQIGKEENGLLFYEKLPREPYNMLTREKMEQEEFIKRNREWEESEEYQKYLEETKNSGYENDEKFEPIPWDPNEE